MKQSIYSQLFSKLGLSEAQAKVYEFLLKNGTKTAGEISKKTNIKRGLTYNALSELEKKGIISQNTKVKITTFTPNHPESLRDFIENKEKEVRDTKLSLESILPNIISDFSLISEKPGFTYIEETEGAKKLLDLFIKERSKDEKEQILNFFDFTTFYTDKTFLNIAQNYSKKRQEKNIKQTSIVIDSKEWSDYVKSKKINLNEIKNEIRIIKKNENYLFKSDINIYNNKILIISKNNTGKIVSILIENEKIFKTFQSLFFIIWNLTENKK